MMDLRISKLQRVVLKLVFRFPIYHGKTGKGAFPFK